MPNRIIRDAILTSETVCSLGWAEEVFYRRLMSIVDDYGRYEANPQLLRSRCYPLQTDHVPVSDIEQWLIQCANAGLVQIYNVAGKRYLQINKFGQQQRSASKFPQPPADDINCYQAPANEHLDVSVFGVVDEVDIPAMPKAPPVVDKSESVDKLFNEFWQAYPKKRAKDDAMKAFAKRKPDRALLSLMLNAIDAHKCADDWVKDSGQFIPYPATWLNDGRWNDEQTQVHSPPIKTGLDPELVKINEYSKAAAPVPNETRQKFQELLRAKRLSASHE